MKTKWWPWLFVLALSLSFSCATLKTTLPGTQVEELKVGDKMPDLSAYVVIDAKYIQLNYTKQGYRVWLGKKGTTDWEYAKGYLVCHGVAKDLPFGVYHSDTDTLYVDNNPTDGIIDAIIKGTEGNRYLYQDAPDCGIHV